MDITKGNYPKPTGIPKGLSRDAYARCYTKKRRAEEPGYAKMEHRRTREWRRKNPAAYLYVRVRANAKQRGLEFSLTKEDITEMLIPMKCEVTGLDLIYSIEGRVPNSPSLDRIDSSKGYVKGNVQLVSWIYNRAKGNSSTSDVIKYLIEPLIKKNSAS